MNDSDTGSIFWGLLPLVLLGLIIYWIYRATRSKAPGVAGPGGLTPYGVEGVLAFYIIVSRYIGPLFGAAATNAEFTNIKLEYPDFYASEAFAAYMRSVWAYLAMMTAVNWWSTSKLKSEFVPSSVKITVWSLAGMAVTTPVVIALLFILVLDAPLQGNVDELIAASKQPLVAAIIWILYFKLSKRVKNTYITGPTLLGRSDAQTATDLHTTTPRNEGGVKSPSVAVTSQASSINAGPDTVPDAYGRTGGVDPDRAFALALAEFEGPHRNQGRWARLFAHFEGSEAPAKAAYLREVAEHIGRAEQVRQKM